MNYKENLIKEIEELEFENESLPSFYEEISENDISYYVMKKGELKGIEETEKEFADWLESLEYNDKYPVLFFEQIENKIKELKGAHYGS